MFTKSVLVLLADPFATSHDNDIPAGEFEVLDIVMRPPDSKQCIGWSEAHLLATGGAPHPVGETVTLEPGRYQLLIEANTGGRMFDVSSGR